MAQLHLAELSRWSSFTGRHVDEEQGKRMLKANQGTEEREAASFSLSNHQYFILVKAQQLVEEGVCCKAREVDKVALKVNH